MPASEVEVGLSLGSNMGDKPANILRALHMLAGDGTVRVSRVSSLYRTAPWGPVAQDFFANACALVRTSLPPLDLLAHVKRIEAAMGRKQAEHWGPRLIDIDLLFYGELMLSHPTLTLPHPEVFNRAFVLVPLAQIAPDLRISGRSVAQAALDMADADVEAWTNPEV